MRSAYRGRLQKRRVLENMSLWYDCIVKTAQWPTAHDSNPIIMSSEKLCKEVEAQVYSGQRHLVSIYITKKYHSVSKVVVMRN